MHPENNCILCYCDCSVSNNRQIRRKRNSKSTLLDDQVAVIFILRKLLEIPKSFCENLLSQSGNPSGWIRSCDSCTKVITDAHSTFKEITNLQNKYDRLKTKIKTTISNSKLKYSTNTDKDGIRTTDDIRKWLLKDLGPIICVSKLNPDVVLKVEPDAEIEKENDWQPGNYDEEYKLEVDNEVTKTRSTDNVTSISQRSNSEVSDEEDEAGSNSNLNEDSCNDSDWEANLNNENSDSESDKSEDECSINTLGDSTKDVNKVSKRKSDDFGRGFKTSSKLKLRTLRKHPTNLPHKCEKCKFSFKTGAGLKRHCTLKHRDTELQNVAVGEPVCKICGNSYRAEFMKSHMLIHFKRVESKLSCEICNKGFNTEYELITHQRGQHYKELNLEPYECKECNQIFTSSSNLRGHNLVKHKIDETKICSICNVAYRTTAALQNHMEKAHEMEKFPCDLCDKIFNDRPRLENHVMSQHTKHYECEICKRVFSRMDYLRNHQRGVHYKELNLEPYKCTVCDKVFKALKHLNVHTVMIHTKAFSAFCSICNKGFYSKAYVRLHVRKVHNKEKNFTCSFCGMGFFIKPTHDAHVISQHTKEYAVTCEICGHGSATIPFHEKHMKIHASKSFTCELCGVAYKLQYELQQHQRGHHHEELKLEPFKCTECGEICKSRQILRNHMEKDHQLEKLNSDVVLKVKPDAAKENDCHPVNHDEEYKVSVDNEDTKTKSTDNVTSVSLRSNTEVSDEIDEAYPNSNLKEDSCNDSDGEANLNNEDSDSESDKSEDECNNTNKGDSSKDISNVKKRICDDCGRDCKKPSKLKQHILRKHTKNLPLKCKLCNFSFKTSSGLKLHHLRNHPDIDWQNVVKEKIVCELCGQSYNADYMKSHMLLIHSENVEKKKFCEICQMGFYRADELRNHQRGKHYKELNLEPHKCEECNKIFSSKKSLDGHNIVKHKKGGGKICSICDKAFKSRIELQTHVERIHDVEKFPCSLCDRFFKDESKLESHVMSSHTKHYECEICKRVFLRMDFLRNHQRGVHYKELNLEPYKCTVCDKVFKALNHLKLHTVNIHTKAFSAFCSICNEGFYSKAYLRLHVRKVHNKEKNYTCSFCGMGFFIKQACENHVISQHTKEYVATCEICGHGSATLPCHEQHMKIHGSKSFTCELCGASYKLQYELQEHQRGVHHEALKLEPFKCTECGTICNSRSTLRNHVIKQHTENSNFPCSHCDKIFMSKPKRNDHVRKHHTGEKPYKCDICNESFYTSELRRRHTKIHSENFK